MQFKTQRSYLTFSILKQALRRGTMMCITSTNKFHSYVSRRSKVHIAQFTLLVIQFAIRMIVHCSIYRVLRKWISQMFELHLNLECYSKYVTFCCSDTFHFSRFEIVIPFRYDRVEGVNSAAVVKSGPNLESCNLGNGFSALGTNNMLYICIIVIRACI